MIAIPRRACVLFPLRADGDSPVQPRLVTTPHARGKFDDRAGRPTTCNPDMVLSEVGDVRDRVFTRRMLRNRTKKNLHYVLGLREYRIHARIPSEWLAKIPFLLDLTPIERTPPCDSNASFLWVLDIARYNLQRCKQSVGRLNGVRDMNDGS